MKKLKLAMSIATMCLALMVLCFGVYSATNITYTIGGSISYEVTDVFADVTTRVYTSSFKEKDSLQTTVNAIASNGSVDSYTDTNYKYDFSTTGADNESYNNTTAMSGNTEGGIKIEYNSTTKRTYFVVVSITNKGSNIINAVAKTPTLDSSANTLTGSVNKIAKIEKDGTARLVFAFMLDEITKGVTGVPFEYVITLSNGEYIEPTGTLDYVLPTGVSAQTKVYSQNTMPYEESGVLRASKLRTFAKSLETNNTLSNETKTYDFTSSQNDVKYSLDESNTLNFIITKITNNSGSDVYVKLTDKKEMSFYSTNTYIYRSQDVESLANGQSTTLVVAYKKYKDGQGVALKDAESGYIFEVGNKSEYSPLKFAEAQFYPNSTHTRDAYYYVEMGDFYGLPVRWMLIATQTTETTGDGVYKYSDNKYYKNFVATKDNKPTNTSGIFYQETNTGISMAINGETQTIDCYSERNEEEKTYFQDSDNYGMPCDVPLTGVSYNSYNKQSDKAIKNGVEQETYANNYFNSKIRDYLIGTTDINKSTMHNANSDNKYLDLESGDKSCYTKDLNISKDNSIFKKIQKRTQMETKTGSYGDKGWDTSNGTDYAQGQAINDNFWLLSMEEILTWVGGTTILNSQVNGDMDLISKIYAGWGYFESEQNAIIGANWFRSGSASSGDIAYVVNYFVVNTVGKHFIGTARAAFNMAI